MTIMLLAILPNWNSLDSVRQAHSDLEAAGLVFFALLVIAEALAHTSGQDKKKHLFDSIGIWFFATAVLCEIGGYRYGQRNDALSGQVIVSLDAKAGDAFTKASSALTKAGEAEIKSEGAVSKADEAVGKVGAATQAAVRAKDSADKARETLRAVIEEVNALSPRNLTLEQQSKIAQSLKGIPQFPYPTIIESYGMDGEGTALATQLIRTLEATGYGTPGDGRADKVVSGGFEWGISIRGPAYEMAYMTALRDGLVNIGKLQEVSINGPSAPVGTQLSGSATISGSAAMSGGGGPPVQLPVPTKGPVMVLVGIRPPTVLPESGKQQ